MGKSPLGERVAALETLVPAKVDELRKDVNALAGTVTIGMANLREELAEQSLNGRTMKAKALVDDIGDDDSRKTLKAVIKGHDRREWLYRPIFRYTGAFVVGGAGVIIGHFWPR
jgi:hypothetical protein